MKLFKKKVSVQNDNWKFWDFHDEEDCYGLTFVDATYIDPAVQKNFKKEYYLKVLIPENKLITGKLPLPETNTELQVLEEELITLLERNKIKCKQVLRYIYYGGKRMLFEVADLSDFEEVVSGWKHKLGDYSLEIIEEDPWVIYNEMQPNEYAWQQMGNRQVYEQLIAHGSNPDKVHLIEHAIFGNYLDLKRLEEELHKEGGKTLTFENDMLEIGFESPLDLEEINGMTYYLMDKSKELNCQYDGWCTAIVK